VPDVSIVLGPDAARYVPVVDISRHQGAVDFVAMRAKGVAGLIFRSNHATVEDVRFAEYVAGARAAGFADADLGAYTFCNPKRATGEQSAVAMVQSVRRVFGHTRLILMLDVESYTAEPGGDLPVLSGAPFAAWLRAHLAALRSLAPDATIIGYTNAAYWNSPAGPRDADLAAELDWIVPRYPVYSTLGYARHPLPPDVSGWATWAFARASGPFAPAGADGWEGWQFSAGFNRQGPVYGCSSSDLDLNIVREDAWRRWTAPPPAPSIPVPPTSEVLVKIKTPPPGSPGWWPHIGLFDSGYARVLVSDDITAGAPVEVCADEGQYRRLAVYACGVDLEVEHPTGHAAPVEVTVPPIPPAAVIVRVEDATG
jgi:hypothetical protein